MLTAGQINVKQLTGFQVYLRGLLARVLLRFDCSHFDCAVLRVQAPGGLDLLSHELGREILIVQLIDVLSRRKYEVSSKVLNAVAGARRGRPPMDLGFNISWRERVSA